MAHSQFARSVLFSCGGELCEPLKEAKRVKGLRSEVWLHTKQGSDCQAAVDIIFTARGRVVSSAWHLVCGRTVIATSVRHEFVFCCKCCTCRRGWCGSRGSCGCCCGQGQAGDRAARARNGGIREDIVRAAAQRAPSHGKEAVLSHQPRPCCELTSLSLLVAAAVALTQHTQVAYRAGTVCGGGGGDSGISGSFCFVRVLHTHLEEATSTQL